VNDKSSGSQIKGILLFAMGITITFAGIYLDAQLHAQYRSFLPYLVPNPVIVITAGFFVVLVGLFVTFYGMVIIGRN
jgi:hypothetical protein